MVDYAAMERAGAEAMYAAIHEKRPYHNGDFASWSEVRTPMHPFHYNDGVTILVTAADMSPDDHFTTDENASPVAHQAPPGEQQVDHGEEYA